MITIYPSLTTAYAKAIYIDGTRRFAEIREEYVQPVKELAAVKYREEQILNAFERQWITDSEFNETMTLKASLSPEPV